MKLVLKNSNLTFQKESEPEWVEVAGFSENYGWGLFGNQFVNDDVIKVKLEVVSPAPNYEAGAQMTFGLGTCTEEQTSTHGTSIHIPDSEIYVNNTAGFISEIKTVTISTLNESRLYVCGTAFNATSTRKPITVKWYYYKVQ